MTENDSEVGNSQTLFNKDDDYSAVSSCGVFASDKAPLQAFMLFVRHMMHQSN
jgi:hypothetical protein